MLSEITLARLLFTCPIDSSFDGAGSFAFAFDFFFGVRTGLEITSTGFRISR